jgi:8-amino-7-oxononanoate synthase
MVTIIMSDALNWLPDELRAMSEDGLFRCRREVCPIGQGQVLVDGRHEAWDFASNDYLGLANHPHVVAAAENAIHSHGVGAKASPLVSGRTDWHSRLERALVAFEGCEAAILFPTGMAANVGTVAALAGAGDAVFCDRWNHASLVDGCRLSGARLRVFRHDDLDGLKQSLARESARRTFLLTDSVFSMDGDLAPLPELCDIAEKHKATIILDEAHGTGVFGQRGRGVAEMQGVEDRIPVRIGTLSKSIGSLGGFVVGSQPLIEFLWNKARTQIYSTALPPALCAAAVAALEIIQTEPSRRDRLLSISKSFREQLLQNGVDCLAGSVGPIVPIVLYEPQAAVQLADRLLSEGFLVGAIRPPTVARGTSRLRVTLHYGLPDDAIASLAKTIGELLK